MKKLRSIILSAVAVVAALSVCVGLAACGGSSAATLESSYVYSEIVDGNAYGGTDTNTYEVFFYDDGTYMFTETTVVYGYTMNLGTTIVNTFGAYTEGTTADGYTSYTLAKADRVIVNFYSSPSSSYINIDTATATYPTELPAQTQGEQNMAQSADDVISAYGTARTIYVSTTTNTFSLTNPADAL